MSKKSIELKSLDELECIDPKFYIFLFKQYDDGKCGFSWDYEPRAKAILLEDYEDIDFFIFKFEENKRIYWNITDAYTGSKIYASKLPETKKDAIENAIADMKIKKVTKEKLIKLIVDRINKYSLSPRYQTLI